MYMLWVTVHMSKRDGLTHMSGSHACTRILCNEAKEGTSCCRSTCRGSSRCRINWAPGQCTRPAWGD